MSDDLKHPIFARLYPRLDAGLAGHGGTEHRAELLAGVSGRLLEIGAGHGANFAHYPPEVTEAIAIEPEPRLRALAVSAAARSRVPVSVRSGRAESLTELDDGCVDVAIASLVLCSVQDPQRALTELYRVIRPGGQLRFYEHIRAASPWKVRVQRAADLLWPFLAAGCHVSRPSDQWIRNAGFTVRSERRFAFPENAPANPASPHVIGTAIRRS